MHDRKTRRDIRSSALITCSLAALAVACSGGEVNLGDGLLIQPSTPGSRCSESVSLTGDINVANQSQLDELRGCEEITGSLRIEPFAGADLSPLRSLRRVSDALEVAAQPSGPFADEDEQFDAGGRWRTLVDAGWLDTLGGLASLSSVDALLLSGGITVEDLTELTSLRSISTGLSLTELNQLRNLHGLEQTTLTGIWIGDCDALESLNGLHMAPSANLAYFELLPALKDIEALASVEHLSDSLVVVETGIEALPDLALLSATEISISANTRLMDASGLAGLQYVTRLSFVSDPLLHALPDLSEVYGLDDLKVAYNSSLEELNLNFPALEPERDLINVREIQYSAAFIEISNNAALRRVTSPASFTAIQYFSVYQNPSLTDLDLGTLQRADFLMIDDNAALASVSAPSLATVDELEVTNNPALVPSVFDDIQTFKRVMSGNAAPSAPSAP